MKKLKGFLKYLVEGGLMLPFAIFIMMIIVGTIDQTYSAVVFASICLLAGLIAGAIDFNKKVKEGHIEL